MKDLETVVNLYNKGFSGKDITKLLNRSEEFVYLRLKRSGIILRKRGTEHRKHTFNEDYFNQIDSEDKAYFLGLLYADGCLLKDGVRIRLQERDKNILELFTKAIGYSGNLKTIELNNKNKNWQNQSSLSLYSLTLKKDLSDKGCVKAKSLILNFPTFIPDNLLSHFIRGYFDGDGGVYFYKKRNNPTAGITSTYNFCMHLKKILQDRLSINSCVSLRSNKITATIYVSGFKNVLRFLEYLYKDANFYIKRKNEKYKAIHQIALSFDRTN